MAHFTVIMLLKISSTLFHNVLFLYCSYENADIALNCGVMLRECIRHELLANDILRQKYFYNFFEYVELSTFDIASDAFSSFKVS